MLHCYVIGTGLLSMLHRQSVEPALSNTQTFYVFFVFFFFSFPINFLDQCAFGLVFSFAISAAISWLLRAFSHTNLSKILHIRAGILVCSSHLHIPNLSN